MQSSLEIRDVHKTYGPVHALHPTNLTIHAGEFLTLLGPSGSGKTTLLMAIAGFVEPSGGRMLLGGRDITALPPEKRNFGVVFQGYALFPHLTVWENVYFPLRARGIARSEARPKVEAALDLIELGHVAGRKPSELSGGQQQRVALARALVFEPAMLLLDEPLSALDKALLKTLQAELKAIHRRIGTTFLYVTHDQEEALSMSDRVAILRDGRIQQIDSPTDLYERPRTEFVAGFLGRSNFLKGKVTGRQDGRLLLDSPYGRLEVATEEQLPAGRQVTLGLRPERIRLCPAVAADATNVVAGRVADVSYLGPVAEVEVETAGGRLGVTTLTDAGAPPVTGDVWLQWEAASAVLLQEQSNLPDGHR